MPLGQNVPCEEHRQSCTWTFSRQLRGGHRDDKFEQVSTSSIRRWTFGRHAHELLFKADNIWRLLSQLFYQSSMVLPSVHLSVYQSSVYRMTCLQSVDVMTTPRRSTECPCPSLSTEYPNPLGTSQCYDFMCFLFYFLKNAHPGSFMLHFCFYFIKRLERSLKRVPKEQVYALSVDVKFKFPFVIAISPSSV